MPPRSRLHPLLLAALFLCAGSAAAQEGEGGGQTGGSGWGGSEELPAPLDGLFEALNPARAHRWFDDRILGLDVERSEKPRAPELPLAVFVESVRPLGALKYENQLNYFVGTFAGDAPTLETLT